MVWLCESKINSPHQRKANVVTTENNLYVCLKLCTYTAFQCHECLPICEQREDSVRSLMSPICPRVSIELDTCFCLIQLETLISHVSSLLWLSLNLKWQEDLQDRRRTEILQNLKWSLVPWILFSEKWPFTWLYLYLYMHSHEM